MNYKILVTLLAICQAASMNAAWQVPDSTYYSAEWIKASEVMASVGMVESNADTLSFDISSMKTHDGDALESLIGRIPGMEVDHSGRISVNGRHVSQILIDGKRYFSGNAKGVLMDIPSHIVDRIRTYERETDFGRISGAASVSYDQTLEIIIKEEYRHQLHGSLNVAGGVKKKYDAHAGVNLFSKDKNLSLVAASDNIGSIQHSSGTSIRSGLGDAAGKCSSKAGITFASDRHGMDISGNLMLKSDVQQVVFAQEGEYFKSNGNHETDATGSKDDAGKDISAQMNMEWKDSHRNTFQIKPALTYNHSRDVDAIVSDSFRDGNAKSYYTSDKSTQQGSGRLGAGSTFAVSHKSDKAGRSLSFNADVRYREETDDILSDMLLTFRIGQRESVSSRIRHCISAVRSLTFAGQLLWTEPVGQKGRVQLGYTQRLVQDRSSREYWILENGTNDLDAENNSKGMHSYEGGNLTASYVWCGNKLKLMSGLSFQPSRTSFRFTEDSHLKDTTAIRLHAAPEFNLEWNRSKNEHIRLIYSCYTTEPAVSKMLPLAANTNPMYIQEANPGLRPSFSQEAKVSWTKTGNRGRRGVNLNMNGRFISDDVTSFIADNPHSSGRIVTPTNVDGNWEAGANLVLHTMLKGFRISSHTTFNAIGKKMFIYDKLNGRTDACTTYNDCARERLVLSYKNDIFESSLLAEAEFNHQKVSLRPEMTLFPHMMSLGASMMWRSRNRQWTVSADVRDSKIGGYSFDKINRNVLIINSKASYRLPNGKVAFQFDFRDILGNHVNYVGTFSTESRYITFYDGSSSYCLFRIIVDI